MTYAPALTDITTATETFNVARVINKDALKALVEAAEANIAEPYAAEANLADPMAAPKSAIDAYRSAIDAAIAVSQNDSATTAEVADAIAALNAATAALPIRRHRYGRFSGIIRSIC